MKLRCAALDDAADLALLCGELGYSASAEELLPRLEAVFGSVGDTLLVAEGEAGVIGFVHAQERQSLTAQRHMEVVALVVRESERGRGVGKRLIRAVLEEARRREVERVRVRSRLQRAEAHQFYLGLGFTVTKEQCVFDCTLENS
jgi:GNAT superfamily N-acetyltransferase